MDDLVGLFVAMCRSLKIPARMVWVPDYSYAEFYLEDAEGKGLVSLRTGRESGLRCSWATST